MVIEMKEIAVKPANPVFSYQTIRNFSNMLEGMVYLRLAHYVITDLLITGKSVKAEYKETATKLVGSIVL